MGQWAWRYGNTHAVKLSLARSTTKQKRQHGVSRQVPTTLAPRGSDEAGQPQHHLAGPTRG